MGTQNDAIISAAAPRSMQISLLKLLLILLAVTSFCRAQISTIALAQPLPAPGRNDLINRLAAWPNISGKALGANVAQLDRAPLAGANKYVVQRNGEQVGPDIIPIEPRSNRRFKLHDNVAPANSPITYRIIAYVSGSIPRRGAPQQPANFRTRAIP